MTSRKKTDSPTLPPVFLKDVERTMHSLNHAFDPLHRDCIVDYHVSESRNGYVHLSVALPEGMTRAFVTLLQSLTGFFRFADHKARMASIEERVIDPDEIRRRKSSRDDFQNEVCRIFDEFRGQGLDRKEAVKATNSTLKSAKHPWANHAAITDALRSAGRFKRKEVER